MRIAILADVHGSLTALEAMLDDLHKYRPDHIIVARDMIAGPLRLRAATPPNCGGANDKKRK